MTEKTKIINERETQNYKKKTKTKTEKDKRDGSYSQMVRAK